jgi:hypothetical protein
VPTFPPAGITEFPYTIQDKSLLDAGNSSAYVKIVVKPPLTAVNDSYTTPYNTPITVVPASRGFLSNDRPTAPECPIDMRAIEVAVPAGDGVVSGLNPLTGEFTFTPVRGFRGNATFTYCECWRHEVGVLHVVDGAGTACYAARSAASESGWCDGMRTVLCRQSPSLPPPSESQPPSLTPLPKAIEEPCSAATATAVVTIEVPPPAAISAADDFYTASYNKDFTPTTLLILANDNRCASHP